MPEPPQSESGTPQTSPTFLEEHAALQRLVAALADAGHQAADPTRLALDGGGQLDPNKPFCWILASGTSSMRPPRPFEGLTKIVLGMKQPRLCIARIMMRTPTHALIDIYDRRRVAAIAPKLGEIAIRLGIMFDHSNAKDPPQSEVVQDDPADSG